MPHSPSVFNLLGRLRWVYWLATWFLVVADTLFYLGLQPPYGPGAVVDTPFIGVGQVVGAALLLVGSLIYVAWATFPPAAKLNPLMDEFPMP